MPPERPLSAPRTPSLSATQHTRAPKRKYMRMDLPSAFGLRSELSLTQLFIHVLSWPRHISLAAHQHRDTLTADISTRPHAKCPLSCHTVALSCKPLLTPPLSAKHQGQGSFHFLMHIDLALLTRIYIAGGVMVASLATAPPMLVFVRIQLGTWPPTMSGADPGTGMSDGARHCASPRGSLTCGLKCYESSKASTN